MKKTTAIKETGTKPSKSRAFTKFNHLCAEIAQPYKNVPKSKATREIQEAIRKVRGS